MSHNLKKLKGKLNIDDTEHSDPSLKAQQLFSGLTDYWTGLSRKMASMGDKVKELNEKWYNKEPIVHSDANMASAITRSRYCCQKIKECWQTLHKDKSNRILSMNEEQLHQLEKIKIENNCKKLSKLLCNICYTALGEVTEKLEDWYTVAQVAIVQSDCLFKELAIFMNDCDQLQQCLNQVREQERRSWTMLLDSSPTSPTSSNGSAPSTASCSKDRLSSPATNNAASQHAAQNSSERPLLLAESLMSSDAYRTMPANLVHEISLLREAHSKLWTALEENQAVISEFESLSVDSGHAV